MTSDTAKAPKDSDARRSMISARALTKTFGQGETAVTALDHVDIDIRENEFFTLLGPWLHRRALLSRALTKDEPNDERCVSSPLPASGRGWTPSVCTPRQGQGLTREPACRCVGR